MNRDKGMIDKLLDNIKQDNMNGMINEVRMIDPDYKMLCQFLQGWIAGRGYADELTKDMDKLVCSFMQRCLFPKM